MKRVRHGCGAELVVRQNNGLENDAGLVCVLGVTSRCGGSEAYQNFVDSPERLRQQTIFVITGQRL